MEYEIAPLADLPDGRGVRVRLEHVQQVDEPRADDGVAAQADTRAGSARSPCTPRRLRPGP